jgi:hypothetical protein
MAEEAPAAAVSSWPLGRELSAAVFLRLPPAARLLARAVCRDWRETLSDPAMWHALDVSCAPPPLLPRGSWLKRMHAATPQL